MGKLIVVGIGPGDYENMTVDYKSYGFNKVVGQAVINSSYYVGEQKDGSIIIPPYSIVILK